MRNAINEIMKENENRQWFERNVEVKVFIPVSQFEDENVDEESKLLSENTEEE